MVPLLKRRDVLGALAAAGAAGVAGCSVSPPVADEQAHEYANWLHDPGTVHDDADHYPFAHVDVSTFADRKSALDDDAYSEIESYVDYHVGRAGLGVDDVDWLVEGNVAGIAACSRSKTELSDALESEGYDQEASHQEYTVYVPGGEESPASSMAVADDRVVSTGNVQQPVDAARAVIETGAGESPRYAAEREPMGDLLDALDDGAMGYGSTHEEVETTRQDSWQFEGMVAHGRTFSFDGDDAEIEWTFIHRTTDDVDVDAVEEWVESDTRFAELAGPEVSQSGRNAVVTGTAPIDDAPLVWP